MALTNLDAPFGLRPARLLGGGAYTGGQNRYEISNSDTTKIYPLSPFSFSQLYHLGVLSNSNNNLRK